MHFRLLIPTAKGGQSDTLGNVRCTSQALARLTYASAQITSTPGEVFRARSFADIVAACGFQRDRSPTLGLERLGDDKQSSGMAETRSHLPGK